MNLKMLSLLFGLLAIGLALGGCGSDDADSQAGTSTKAQFVRQANSICKEAVDKREARYLAAAEAAEKVKKGPLFQTELEKVLAKVALPLTRKMVGELAELDLPAGEEEKVGTMIRAFEQGMVKMDADPRTASTGTAFSAAKKMARPYGVTECKV